MLFRADDVETQSRNLDQGCVAAGTSMTPRRRLGPCAEPRWFTSTARSRTSMRRCAASGRGSWCASAASRRSSGSFARASARRSCTGIGATSRGSWTRTRRWRRPCSERAWRCRPSRATCCTSRRLCGPTTARRAAASGAWAGGAGPRRISRPRKSRRASRGLALAVLKFVNHCVPFLKCLPWRRDIAGARRNLVFTFLKIVRRLCHHPEVLEFALLRGREAPGAGDLAGLPRPRGSRLRALGGARRPRGDGARDPRRVVSSREIRSTLRSSRRIDAKECISALWALTSIRAFGTMYV